MNLYSSDYSILVNKVTSCDFDLKVNPSFGGGGGTGPIAVQDSNTIILQGNGTTVPLEAILKISAIGGNAISVQSDGIYVSPASPYTDAQARAAISGLSPLSYNPANGQMSIATAGIGQTGALSSIDYAVFNSKVSGAANIGGGIGLYKQKTATSLEFKTLVQGANTTIQEIGDTVVITAGGNTYTDAQARAAISNLAPIQYNTVTGQISITQGGPSTSGYISSTDWNTFNNKVPLSRNISTTSPLTGGGNLSSDLTLGIQKSNSVADGYLSKEDWITFNSKQSPIIGQHVTAGSSKITLSGVPTGAVLNPFSIDINESNILLQNLGGVLPIIKGGTGQTTAIAAINALVPSQSLQAGKVLGTDGTSVQWVTGGGGGGGENPLTFTGPLRRIGNNISIDLSTASADGYLSSSNFNFFSNKVGDAVNIGASGASVFASKLGNNLQFRKLVQGTNIIITENADNITIGSTAGGGGGSAHAINTTVAELKANNAPSITLPYYITDVGQEGFFYYDAAGGSTVSNGGATNNSGTIIRSANGRVYRRSFDNVLDIRWFGGKADYVSVSGVMTGTDNAAALNFMMAATGTRQQMYIPYGSWYFATSPNIWTNSKQYHLTIEGDTYHNSVNFIEVRSSSNTLHKFYHRGYAYGRIGLPLHNKATYDAGTDPDWDSFTGAFIYVFNSAKCHFEMNFVEGFRSAIRMAAGAGGDGGSQENTFRFKWLRSNAFGIHIVSENGASYNDKNHFYGGRIGGDRAIVFDGNETGTPKNALFLANTFDNVLIEAANSGLEIDGAVKFTSFVNCKLEGGSATGVFGPLKMFVSDNATGNSFTGFELLNTDWLANPGNNTMVANTPLYISGTHVGSTILGGVSTGRITMLSTSSYSNSTKALIGSNVDIIRFLATSSTALEARPNEFANVRLNGVDYAVSYDGKALNIAAAGDYDMPIPPGYIRVAAGTGNVRLMVLPNQLISGKVFYIEQVGTGTLEIVRTSDSVSVMPTTAITSPGVYMVRYLNAGSFSYTATKLGGTSGGGVVAIGTLGTGNANAASISGTTLTLHAANATQPGVWTTGTQELPGNKTITGTITLQAQAGSGTRMLTVDAAGVIGNQTIPSGGGGSYTFSTGLAESGGVVTSNLSTGAAVTTQYVVGSVNSGGNLGLRSTTNASKGRIIAEDSIQLRANTTAVNTAPLIFATSSTQIMAGSVNGALQFDATDLFITCATFGTQKIATATNNLIFQNKTWNASPITYGYGGTGLTTLGSPGQSYRVNAGGTAIEWYTPAGGGGSSSGVELEISKTKSGNNTTSINNNASEVTVFSGTPAAITAGTMIEVEGSGSVLVAAANTNYVSLRFTAGGFTYPLFIGPAGALATAGTKSYNYRWVITPYATGTVVNAHCYVTIHIAGEVQTWVWNISALNTNAPAVAVTAQWNTASASNTFTQTGGFITTRKPL